MQYSDINSVFNLNVVSNYRLSKEEIIDKKFGQGSYVERAASIDDLYKKMVFNKDANIELYKSKNIEKKKKALEQIKLLKESDKILGIDLETLGSMSNEKGVSSKGFAVTEIGLVELDKKGEKLNLLFNLEMGINGQTALDSLKLYTMLEEGQMFEHGVYEESAKVISSRAKYNLKMYDSNLPINAENISESIIKLQNRPIVYNSVGSRSATPALEELRKTIVDAMEEGTPLMGHNLKNADIPWLNKAFVDNGLEAIDFSSAKLIDTLEIVQEGLSEDLFEIYRKAGLAGQEKQMSLSSLVKLTNQEINSHNAVSDITANILGFIDEIPEMEESLIDLAESNLENKISSTINLSTLNDEKPKRVLYSEKSIKSDELFGIDFIVDDKGNTSYYKNYSTQRGVFYEFEGLSVTPREKIPGQIQDMINNDFVFSIKLKAITGEESFGHSVVLSSDNYEDLVSKINNSMSVKEVGGNLTLDYMAEQFTLVEKDNARRNFMAMFDPSSGKGFNYADKMFSSHANIRTALGPELTDENLLKLLKEKVFITKKHEILDLKTIAPSLFNQNGVFIQERARDLYHSFGIMDDVSSIIEPAIEEIKKKINIKNGYGANKPALESIQKDLIQEGSDIGKEQYNILNRKRTEALKIYKSKLESDVIGDNVKLLSYGDEIDTFSQLNYASFKLNNDYINIDTSSYENLVAGLNRNLYKVPNSKTSLAKKSITKTNLNIMINDLYERKILSEADFNSFSEIGDTFTGIKSLAQKMFNKAEENRALIKNGDTSDVILNLKPVKEYFGESRVLINGNVEDSISDYIMENVTDIVNKTNNTLTNEVTFREYINENIDRATKSILPNSDIYVKKSGEKFLKFDNVNQQFFDEFLEVKNSISDFLKKNLNYNDEQILEVTSRILGEDSSLMNNGMSVSLISFKDKNKKTQFGLMGFFQKDLESVQRDINSGIQPSRAIIQPLPKVNSHLNGRIKTVQTGYVEENISQFISSFVGDDGDIVYSLKDTLIDSIQSPKKEYRKVNELIAVGKFEQAQKIVERAAMKPIYEASGASAFQTVSVDGVKKKMFVPKVSDLLRKSRIDSVVHSVPRLYSENKDVFNSMNESIGEDRVLSFLDIMKKNPNASLSEATSSIPEVREWIKTNLFNGEKILEKIVDLESKRGIMSESILDYYKKLLKENPSQITTKREAEFLSVTEVRPEQFLPGGHLNHPRREQILQNLKSSPVLNQELYENAEKFNVKDVRSYFFNKKDINPKTGKPFDYAPGILVGDSMRTYQMHNSYMAPMSKQFQRHEGITTELYGGIVQIDPASMQLKLKEKDIDVLKKEFKSIYGRDLDEDVLKNLIKSISEAGTTHEQSSIVRPSVDRFFAFNDELKTVNVEEEFITKLKIGQTIDKSTLIGTKVIDGNSKAIKYQGESGTISFIDEFSGKVFVSLDNPSFEQKKYIYHGFEKSVGNSFYSINGTEYFDEGEFLFDSLFGKSTMAAAYLPFGKHETGSVMVVPKIALLGEMAKQADNSTQDKIIDLINKRMKGWDVGYNIDAENGLGKVLLTKVPHLDGSDIDSVNLLIEDIKNIAKDSSDYDMQHFAKSYLDFLNYYEENDIIYGPLKKTTLSEFLSHSTYGEGKGMKYSKEMDNLLGAFYNDDYIIRNSDGSFSNIIDPIKKYLNSEVKKNNKYYKSEKEFKNLLGTIEAYRENDISKLDNYRVGKVKIKDLDLPPPELLNLENLNASLFSKYKDKYDILAIEMENTEITNPLVYREKFKEKYDELIEIGLKKQAFEQATAYATEQAKTSTVFIPISSPLFIDDTEMYYSKQLRESAGVISDIQRLENLEVANTGGIAKTKKSLENRVKNLVVSAKHELNDKKGLLRSQMLTGRLDYSTSLLNVGIADMHFTERTADKVLHPFGQRSIKEIDGKNMYYDLVGISKSTIEKMGIRDNVIANQILKGNFVSEDFFESLIADGSIRSNKTLNIKSFKEFKKDFDFVKNNKPPTYLDFLKKNNASADSETLKKLLKKRGKPYFEYQKELASWFDDKNDFEQNLAAMYRDYKKNQKNEIVTNIANKYYKEYGIDSFIVRPPAFHNESMMVTKAVLVDSLEGNTTIITEFLAKKLNADIDGDKGYLKFFLETDTNGNVKLMDKNTDISASLDLAMKAQAKANQKYVDEKIEKKQYGFTKSNKGLVPKVKDTENLEFAFSAENYKKAIENMYGHTEILKNNNYFIREKSMQTAIKAMDNMAAIGNISVQNNLLRAMVYAKYDDNLKKDFQNVLDFTHTTEQNIISVKHDVDGNLTKAGVYSSDLISMAESTTVEELDLRFEKFVDTMKNSRMYDKDYVLPSVKDIIKGSIDASDENAQQLKSLYTLFLDEDRKNALLEPLNRSGYISGSNKDMDIVLNMLDRIKSKEKEHYKIEILRNLNKKTEITDEILRKKVISGEFDIVKIGKRRTVKKGDGYVSVELADMVTGNKRKIMDKSWDDLSNRLLKEGYSFDAKSGKPEALDNWKEYNLMAEAASLDKSSSLTKPYSEQLIETAVKDLNEEILLKNEVRAKTEPPLDILEEIAKDNFNKKYKSMPNGNETLTDFFKEYKKLSYSEKAKKVNSILESGNNDAFRMIMETIQEDLQDKSLNQVESSTMSKLIDKVNENIIKKADVAKKNNQFKKELIKKELFSLISEQNNVRSYSEQIDSLKIINKSQVVNLSNDLNISTNVDFQNMSEEFIKKIYKHNEETILKQESLFNEAFSLAGGKERVLGWQKYSTNNLKNIDILGESKVGFGFFANLKLKDISFNDLIDISKSRNLSEANALTRESISRIEDYLSFSLSRGVKNNNKMFLTSTKIDSISHSYDDMKKIVDVESINKEIIKKANAKKAKSAATKKIADKVTDSVEASKWTKNKYLAAAGIVTGLLGLGIASKAGQNYMSAGTLANKKENDTYVTNLEGDVRPVVYQAPPSKDKDRAIVEGLSITATGVTDKNIDKKSLAQRVNRAVNEATKNNVNVNLNESDDRSEVSDNWIKRKISNILD